MAPLQAYADQILNTTLHTSLNSEGSMDTLYETQSDLPNQAPKLK